MPYIKDEDRNMFAFLGALPLLHEGELNYCITMLCKSFLEQEEMSYASINKIIGVLECAKQEFYRRVAVPYENRKIEENGDVY